MVVPNLVILKVTGNFMLASNEISKDVHDNKVS